MTKRNKSKVGKTIPAGLEQPGRFSLSIPGSIGAILIVLAVVIVYFPSISGGFLLDDKGLLERNRLITSHQGLYSLWSSTKAIDFWPMTNTSFWIEWRLWGGATTGYHFTNCVLHTVETLLIWIVLRKLSIPGAFLAALLFAVHPVNVESVAWISQRKNVLALLFFLLSILWYFKAETVAAALRSQGGPWERDNVVPNHQTNSSSLSPHPSPLAPHLSPLSPHPSPLFYWLSLAAFLSAMLSKGSVAVLPVILLLIIRWLRRWTLSDLVRVVPFFAIAAVLTGVNIWFQKHGHETAFRQAVFLERLLGAGGVLWFYVYKAFLPINLAFIYPQWHVELGKLVWWLPLIAAIIVTSVLWHFRKKNWGASCLFAWGFFCTAILPVMGFTDVGFMRFSLVADHYPHIALIGVVALAGAGWSVWRIKSRGPALAACNVAAATAVAILALLAWRQNGIYTDAIALYKATLAYNQECWMIYDNLGEALLDAGQYKEAESNLRKALDLCRGSYDVLHNLGHVMVKTGRLDEGMDCFKQSIHSKPNYPPAYNSLGDALVKTGRMREAIENFQQALSLDPEYYNAYNNLTGAYVKTRQSALAVATAEKALSVARNKKDTVMAKQIEDWIQKYRAGLPRDENESHSNEPALPKP